MALRLLKIVLPSDRTEELLDVIDEATRETLEETVERAWTEGCTDGSHTTHIVLPTAAVESVVDAVQSRFGKVDGFQIIALTVQAAWPRVKEPEPPESDENGENKNGNGAQAVRFGRVSREELLTSVQTATQTGRVFDAMVVLATIVAAAGMLRSNIAVIVGAMVIAPLLGPNVALALATSLGDGPLAKRALAANLRGVAIAFALAVVLGLVLNVDPANQPEVAARTDVGMSDVALALASGAAGALAFTSGAPASLIGVMVAVALLPPLAALGMLLGGGLWADAYGAGLMLVVNILCVNLAGTATFRWQGVRPRRWWEEKRARSASRNALIAMTVLLAILSALILLTVKHDPGSPLNPLAEPRDPSTASPPGQPDRQDETPPAEDDAP